MKAQGEERGGKGRRNEFRYASPPLSLGQANRKTPAATAASGGRSRRRDNTRIEGRRTEAPPNPKLQTTHTFHARSQSSKQFHSIPFLGVRSSSSSSWEPKGESLHSHRFFIDSSFPSSASHLVVPLPFISPIILQLPIPSPPSLPVAAIRFDSVE